MDKDGQAFKDYVHMRLDITGVPHNIPESEHDMAGCRIGGRLDWVDAKLKKQQAIIDALMLEHCPDEMTPEQMANWERHQKVGMQ